MPLTLDQIDAVCAAYAEDPRPTSRAIAERLGVKPGQVNAVATAVWMRDGSIERMREAARKRAAAPEPAQPEPAQPAPVDPAPDPAPVDPALDPAPEPAPAAAPAASPAALPAPPTPEPAATRAMVDERFEDERARVIARCAEMNFVVEMKRVQDAHLHIP